MSALSGLLTGVARGARKGIQAWHGSPFQFDRFVDRAIGSGEGAQVRGVGHYLATSKGEAMKYKVPRSTFLLDEQVINPRDTESAWDTLPLADLTDEQLAVELFEDALGPAVRRNTGFGARPLTPETLDASYASANKWLDNREMSLERLMQESPDEFGENYYMGDKRMADMDTPEDLRMAYGRMRGLLSGRRVAPNPGRLYRLNVDVDPERMLNYNNPLFTQPQFVQDVIEQKGLLDAADAGRGMQNMTGGELIKDLEQLMDPDYVRDLLRDTGIEGTRYTPYGGTKKRGEHLIIFDPERIKILEMLAAAGVVGAAEALARMQAQQNPETEA